MSAFIALINAVSGLQSQSQALESISGNIANSQTAGYKRVETSFEEMVAGPASASLQQAGSVGAFSRGTQSMGGPVNATGEPTNFALSGPGFAVVRDRVDSGGSTPAFSATNLFTRRGDFALDKNGYLVNGTGQFLCGYPIDPITGARSTAQPEVMRLSVGLAPAKATTRLVYGANLPSTAATDARPTTGTDVWSAVGGTAPASVSPGGSPGSASFAANSVSGQSVRIYDGLGTPTDLDLRWTKLTSGPAATWGLYYNADGGSTTAGSTWRLATTATFDGAGRLVSPTAAVDVDLASRGMGTVSFDLTGGRLTQFDDVDGAVRVATVNQDGFAAGSLNTISVGSTGRVTASFSNGQTRNLFQIAIAQFGAPGGLAVEGSSTWRETAESGPPMLRTDGVSFSGGAVEGSNTDVAQEFSKLIVTQQAYSANTRVMTTVQQMLQDVLNVVR